MASRSARGIPSRAPLLEMPEVEQVRRHASGREQVREGHPHGTDVLHHARHHRCGECDEPDLEGHEERQQDESGIPTLLDLVDQQTGSVDVAFGSMTGSVDVAFGSMTGSVDGSSVVVGSSAGMDTSIVICSSSISTTNGAEP